MARERPIDLLVIGGGIVGTWAAYCALEEHHRWRVVLAERSLIGGGTTRFSLGLSLPLGRTARQRQMAADSDREYRRLGAGIDGLAIHAVDVCFVVGRSGLPELKRALSGSGVREIAGAERDALRARLPALRLARDEVVLGGIAGWCGRPAEVAVALAERVRAHESAAVWDGATVEAVVPDRDLACATLADGRELGARRVIVATGPMLVDGAVAGSATARGIRVKKVVALHFDQSPSPGDPVVFFAEDDAFLLPALERRQWLLSYRSSVWDPPPDPGTFTVEEGDRVNGLALIRRRWPELAGTYVGGRASCDAYSPDWTPLVEAIDDAGRIVLAGGCSGSGFRLAPAIATEAVARVSAARP